MHKEIIMVMGVQRSGTTALFEALRGEGVAPFNETPEDYIYDNYYLRPEPELRSFLAEIPLKILLKPISETFRRSVSDVIAEYRDYDVHIVWIYRDPVNSSHSLFAAGFTRPGVTLDSLAEEWTIRNESILEALREYPERVTVVKYEDLNQSVELLATLGARLGVDPISGFSGDSGGGRRNMPAENQARIDAVTGDMLAKLDSVRLRPQQVPAKAKVEQPAETPKLRTPHPEEIAFAMDPMGELRRRRARGAVQPTHLPRQWVIVGYGAALELLQNPDAVINDAFQMLVWRQSRLLGFWSRENRDRTRAMMESRITPERTRLYASRVAHHARQILDELAEQGQFDVVSQFTERLSANLEPEFAAGATRGTILADIEKDPTWMEVERRDFEYFLKSRLPALRVFVATTMHYLASHADDQLALRNRPEDIPAFVGEMVRLFPHRFGVSQRMAQTLRLADQEIPVGGEVFVILFAANRDPEKFEQPDEMILRRGGPPHLSFGDSPNEWMTRRLGQAEREAIVRVLVYEFPPVQAAGEVRFEQLPNFYIPECLPVRLGE